MSDLYGLPVITSPNLPEGTVLVINPVKWKPLFEPEAIFTPVKSGTLSFHMNFLPYRMPTQWVSSIYNVGDMADDFTEPVKYRGLARVAHMVRRAWRKLR